MKSRMIAGVLMGALFLAVVIYAFAQGTGAPGWSPPMPGLMGMPGPMGMQGPMMRRMISERLDRALDRATVTPEQRVKIYDARDRVFAVFEAQRSDPRELRDQMLAAFQGAELTQAQLDAFHQQQEQRRQAIRAAIDRAILDVHAALTPAQRTIVADYLRNNPMHGRFGGHDGRAGRGPMHGSGEPSSR